GAAGTFAAGGYAAGVAASASILSATAAAALVPNTLAFAIGGVLAGAAGSAISQGINVGLGFQEKFSPIGVAAGAISGGIALGSLSNLNSAFQAINGVVGAEAGSLLGQGVRFLSGSMVGAGSELATQGAFNLIGLQKGIQWEDVASMALTIGGMQALNLKMRFEHMRATDTQVPFMKRFTDGLTQKYRLASAVVESIAAIPYFLGGRPADGMMALAQGAGSEVLGTGDIFDFAMDAGSAIRPGMHYAELTGITDAATIKAVDNMFRDERGFLRQTAMVFDERLLDSLAQHGVTDKTYLYVGKDGSVKPAELYASEVAGDIGQVVYTPRMADRTGMVLPTVQRGVKVGEFGLDGKPIGTQTLGLAGTYIDKHGEVKVFDPLRATRLDDVKEIYGSPQHDMLVKYDLNDVGWIYVKPKALDLEVPLVAVR
ncbi:MAG TPA: hypothetical protein PLQ67_09550, partial [Burkholderiaceae bacterium]|nr:hypothetical protein [Burkholderiaceae bacterium]